MSYEEKNAYRTEQMGYESAHNVKSVGRVTGNVVAADIQRKKESQKNKERAILIQKEQGKGRQLTDLGKLASFIEKFDLIKVEDQILPPVEKIDNPKEQESFIKGYQFGKVLIDGGFSEEKYHKFCEEYERKYNINKGIQR